MMLVLTRREGESIYIGDEIILKILSIQSKNMRIGIAAPQSIEILRDDVKKKRRDLTGHVPFALLARNLRKTEL